MNDTMLRIDRLTASATAPDAEGERVLRTRLPLLLEHAGRRLPALLSVDDAGSHICVRRLELPLRLDPDDPDDRVAEDWARAIAGLIARTMGPGPRDVVRYDSDLAALVDLVATVSSGRWERSWAWRQVGLLDGTTPAWPDADAGRSGVAAVPVGPAGDVVRRALARWPWLTVSALQGAIDRVGVAALDRILGTGGWRALAFVVLQRHGSAVAVDVDPGRPPPGPVDVPSGRLLEAFARSGLRPSAGTARAWAVLGLAAHAPGALRGSGAEHAVAAATARLHTYPGRVERVRPAEPHTDGAPAGPHRSPSTRAAETAGTREPHRTPDAADVGSDHVDVPTGSPRRPAGDAASEPATDQPAAPEADRDPAPEDEARWTAYAGLLFLLATASEAGLPDLLQEDDRLADRHLTRCLHQLGRRLAPVPVDDPALLVLAGLPPDWTPDEVDSDDEPDDEAEAFDDAAEAWRAATLRRLREYGGPRVEGLDDEALLDRVVRRSGRIRHEPGWVEVLLDVTEVDVLVRRAALDLDPGWVWWLGSVVRYRYE